MNDTQLSYDPAAPAGAPTTLQLGQKAVFFTDQIFEVHSQDANHPFYMAAHMTGGSTNSGIGDPEYVNLVPPARFLPSYVFVTDPTYGNTALVFVRQRDENGFQDVALDCLGAITTLDADRQQRRLRIRSGHDQRKWRRCRWLQRWRAHQRKALFPSGLPSEGTTSTPATRTPAGMAVESINTVVVPPTPN